MTDDARNIVGIYRRHAAAFDRLRNRTLFEKAWLDRFAALAIADAPVLDIGCGMGEPIARYLIQTGKTIVGVDTSPALLALARERFPDHEWIEGDMRQLDLGRAFGGVLAWDSFFHLTADDQRRMFPIFATHALPGAPLVFTSGTEAGTAMGTFEGEALYHASLDPGEYRKLLNDNGFDVVDYRPDDPDCGGHTVWLAVRR